MLRLFSENQSLLAYINLKTLETKKTILLLMSSFGFSKLYYWKHDIKKLQLVLNFIACIVLGLKKFDHISQGIKALNWLPVNDRLYLKMP